MKFLRQAARKSPPRARAPAAGGVPSGRPWRSATSIAAEPARGFHLLRIDGYSHTKALPAGHRISSQSFSVGSHTWQLDYYPNGLDSSAASSSGNSISLYLKLLSRSGGGGKQRSVLQARYKFGVLDASGQAAYELPEATGSFDLQGGEDDNDDDDEGPGCGHMEFINKEDLETREGLVIDDCLTVRCDVGFTEVETRSIREPEYWETGGEPEDEDEDEDQYVLGPGSCGGRRRVVRRKIDDGEYVKWFLAQDHAGSRTRR